MDNVKKHDVVDILLEDVNESVWTAGFGIGCLNIALSVCYTFQLILNTFV